MKLDIKDYMHPGDLAALKTIQKIPKFKELMGFISDKSIEKFYRLTFNASNLKLTSSNSPMVYNIIKNACDIFDVKKMPDIFVIRSYNFSVDIFGIVKPIMLISTAVLENLNEKQLDVYLTPYVAAIAAEHTTMNFLSILERNFGGFLPIPEGTLRIPLNHWSKQKEYTYDRVRLRLTNNLEETIGYIGIGETTKEIMSKISLESRLEMSKKIIDYNAGKALSRNTQAIFSGKAWNAMRVIEIFNWFESGAYSSMINREKEDLQ